ncbi:DUF924 family protein [Noviherbaspirillum agri]
MENPDTIREFWFGTSADDVVIAREQSRLWWTKHPDTDALIRQRFAPWLDRAVHHELDAWDNTPTGRLALILLTDQFSRNMYRDTPRAFASDPLALRWCKEGLQQHVDAQLRPIERVFFYLPLEHSESLPDQEQAVAYFQALVDELEPQQRPGFEGFLDFARRHREVVARFGRFPHRNRILGRDSTPEEVVFLSQPGSSF